MADGLKLAEDGLLPILPSDVGGERIAEWVDKLREADEQHRRPVGRPKGSGTIKYPNKRLLNLSDEQEAKAKANGGNDWIRSLIDKAK